MPIYNSEWDECMLFGYYDKRDLVAFTMVIHLDDEAATSEQFAWNYKNPDLRLGIKSLENECAVLKMMGYKYYYLGPSETPNDYKSQLDGFELCGKLQRP